MEWLSRTCCSHVRGPFGTGFGFPMPGHLCLGGFGGGVVRGKLEEEVVKFWNPPRWAGKAAVGT